MNFRYGLLLLPFLAACEQLGIENPAQENARIEAEGKAMGGACRQAGRALEDCYQINAKAQKAAIYTGWREMDAYMRENKIEEVKPEFPMQPANMRRRPLEAVTDPKPKADTAIEKPAEQPAGETKPAAPGSSERKPAEPRAEANTTLKKSAVPGNRST